MAPETEAAEKKRLLSASWEENAQAWTRVVRNGHIPSRRAGTDDAILSACRRTRPQRILDVGCGEGWLARALAADADQVLGVDASEALITAARASGGAEFAKLDYDALVHNPGFAAGPWDAIVCNFALLEDNVVPLLAALRSRLAASGRLLIQTVHPWTFGEGGNYTSGWLEETFEGLAVAFTCSMPWYFRTLSRWTEDIAAAGLRVSRLDEPLHAETRQPLSLLLECVAENDR